MMARRGFAVTVLEKRTDMREHELPGGRSINLALARRGILALQEIDVMSQVQQLALPMRGRLLHDTQGQTMLLPYGKDDTEVIYSVHRGELNKILLDAAAKAGATLRFDSDVQRVDLLGQRLVLANREALDCADRIIIGADGAGSVVRDALITIGSGHTRTDPLDHAYLELNIPRGVDGGFALDPGALHIWPRGDFMLIALPNPDRSFTATLFLPRDGKPDSFSSLHEPREFCHWFERHFVDAVPYIPDLEEQYHTHPIGHLATVHCAPWHNEQALLVGDAAHAIVPFHGQGMNCALEDCTAFERLLNTGCQDWNEMFQSFEDERKPNSEAIARMALENYVEMRARVAEPRFRLRREIEQALENRHPARFVPRYSMVMFHTLPYTEAYRRGVIQTGILRQLSDKISDIDALDWALADRLIDRSLPEPIREPR